MDLTTVNILLNSIFSTPNAKCMTIYVKDFYLNTLMARSEYMCLNLSDLPKSVVQHYNPEAKAAQDGYVYV